MKQSRKSKPSRSSAKRRKIKYAMRLYVTGATPRSTAAITNLRKLCDAYLGEEYDLKVIDVYQQPEKAREGQIIAAPTLVKSLPLPIRRFIGDMSDVKNILSGLEIKSGPAADSSGKSKEG
jgi:circadian clock protein KaiB